MVADLLLALIASCVVPLPLSCMIALAVVQLRLLRSTPNLTLGDLALSGWHVEGRKAMEVPLTGTSIFIFKLIEVRRVLQD